MPRQPFHLVKMSPWPLSGSLGALSLVAGLAYWFHGFSPILLFAGLATVAASTSLWWRDVARESTFMGHHTSAVVSGLRYGMILFIVSEVLFFFSFFWAYYHSCLAPTPEVGCIWPPKGINPFNVMSEPLLNTSVLLASGVTVTWAHHSLMSGDKATTLTALGLTLYLGLMFSATQTYEYLDSPFTISDNVYGSTFYVATGFHGLHVLVGTIFLYVAYARIKWFHLTSTRHLGFELAAWYWHFVDVVWMFLYLNVYWWGS